MNTKFRFICNFQRIFLQKPCHTFFSYQRLTLLTASMCLFQYKRTKSRFDFSMNSSLETLFQALTFFFPFLQSRNIPMKDERRDENGVAITQHFEVMEHEQSAKSCLKKCKFTVKKCLMEFRQKGRFGA